MSETGAAHAAGEREPLSRERIVAAAVDLADSGGLPTVTMRALATHLNCEAMSIYHHIPNKDALIKELGDEASRQVVIATAGIVRDDWRDAVRDRCLAARQVMLAHPWAPTLLMDLSQSPPSSWALFEQLIGTMYEAGFEDTVTHSAIHALGSMVFGFSAEMFVPEAGESDIPDDETMAMMAELMPHMSRMAAVVMHEEDGAITTCDTQAEFEFTLELILEGLQKRRAS